MIFGKFVGTISLEMTILIAFSLLEYFFGVFILYSFVNPSDFMVKVHLSIMLIDLHSHSLGFLGW